MLVTEIFFLVDSDFTGGGRGGGGRVNKGGGGQDYMSVLLAGTRIRVPLMEMSKSRGSTAV